MRECNFCQERRGRPSHMLSPRNIISTIASGAIAKPVSLPFHRCLPPELLPRPAPAPGLAAKHSADASKRNYGQVCSLPIRCAKKRKAVHTKMQLVNRSPILHSLLICKCQNSEPRSRVPPLPGTLGSTLQILQPAPWSRFAPLPGPSTWPCKTRRRRPDLWTRQTHLRQTGGRTFCKFVSQEPQSRI